MFYCLASLYIQYTTMVLSAWVTGATRPLAVQIKSLGTLLNSFYFLCILRPSILSLPPLSSHSQNSVNSTSNITDIHLLLSVPSATALAPSPSVSPGKVQYASFLVCHHTSLPSPKVKTLQPE